MFYETVMWSVIFLVTIVALIAGIIYLVSRIGRFQFVKKAGGDSKLKRRMIPLLILLAFLLLMNFIFGYVNATVIMITLTIFWLFSDFLLWLLKKIGIFKPKGNVSYAGILAIGLSVLYLGCGWYLDHHLFVTEYTVNTDKKIEPIKIVQISDSHLGTTFDGDGFAKRLKEIEKCNPDVVLITGDYIDGSSKYEDIVVATKALGELKTTYGVYFCFGNHDRNFYELHPNNSEGQMVEELKKNNIVILQDEFVELPGGVTIIGREDADVKTREPIGELLKRVNPDDFIIDMNHQPSDYEAEEASGVDMVLSGHTHGGQMVPITYVGLWIGAVDKVYGREKRSDTEFIVTSGISDWALDFKTGCKSEYVIINLGGSN